MEPVRRSVIVPWNRLRAWIDQQEALEHQGHQQLSRAQLEAISKLVPFDTDDEPVVDDRDYVSALHHLTQSRRLPQPAFHDHGPFDVPIMGHLQPKWRCECRVEHHGSFPRREYGSDDYGDAPAFQAKKNAKQYAAKHALQYFEDNWKSPVSKAKAQQAQVQAPVSEAPQEVVVSKASQPALLLPSPSPEPISATVTTTVTTTAASAKATSADSCHEFRLVMEQVAACAAHIGLDPPTFIVEPDPDPDYPNFFTAQAVFPRAKPLPKCFCVNRVFGKKQARQAIAEEVRKWLLQHARDQRFNELFLPKD